VCNLYPEGNASFMTEDMLRAIFKEELKPITERLDKMDCRLTEVEDKLAQLQLLVELKIQPDIQLLYEGLGPISAKAKLLDKIPDMEGELETVYSSQKNLANKVECLSQRVEYIEKAQ